MTACRQQIRAQAAALIGTTTPASDRVYSGRLQPPTADALPCITITTPKARVRPSNTAGAESHSLRLVVTLWAADGADVSDRLDSLAVTVHSALTGAKRLDLPITSLDSRRITMMPVPLGETAAGALSLIYRVRYRNPAGLSDQFI